MQSCKTKTYKVNGKTYAFDFFCFNEYFNTFRKENKLSVGDAELLLAEKVGISENAVHSWRNRVNAPSDISMIDPIAETLGVSNKNTLLIERKEKKMENLNERQMEAVKRIFDSIIQLLYDIKVNRPNEAILEKFIDSLREKYPDATHEELRDLAFGDEGFASVTYEMEQLDLMLHDIECVIAKEYFDLHDTEIYDQFWNLCNNELFDALHFNGQYMSFCEAMKKLHCIIGAEAPVEYYEEEEKGHHAYMAPSESVNVEGDDDLPF